MQTRQRIVELAAPVFNRQGYVGASMRDLTGATGLEKGGIYNHFGSKEQLALEAYDYALSPGHRRARPLAGRRHRRRRPAAAHDPGVRQVRPQARDRRRLPDHEHRDRGRRHAPRAARPGPRVDDALAPARSAASSRTASPTARSRRTPTRTRSPRSLTGSLEGGLMLSRLYDDPSFTDRVVDHLIAHVEGLRARPGGHPMTALDTELRPLARRRARAHDHVDRSRRVALPRPRASSGYERLAAMQARRARAAARGRAARTAPRRGRAAAARCSACSPTRCTRTRWERCTAASSRHSSTPRWVARSRRQLPADAGFTTLELKTNFVRAITPSTGRVYAEGTRRALRRPRRDHRSARARRRTARSTRTPPRRA